MNWETFIVPQTAFRYSNKYVSESSALLRALRHRNFRLFITGQIVSLSGTWMQSVAQSWLVYRLTGSEWLLGVTSFCSNFPVFLLGPIAGVVADRYDRRTVVLIT